MNQTIALIKPEMLIWAREYADDEKAVSWIERILAPKTLEAVEAGTPITIDELRKISNAYDIPLAWFYLPQPPSDPLTVLKVSHPGHPDIPCAYIDDWNDLPDIAESLAGDRQIWEDYREGAIILTVEVTTITMKKFRALPPLDEVL